MHDTDLLDEAYVRFAATGPEFGGWLSNHGPMAVDAMIRLGRADAVPGWIGDYATRLEGPAPERWAIDVDDWREPLGDPSRLGDWIAHFRRLVQEAEWTDVVACWWPRLVPGAIASITHGLIRTGHVVRALRERVTPARLEELAQALGYWAARWQLLPGQVPPGGSAPPAEALDRVPPAGAAGGARTRVAALADLATWPPALTRLRPVGAPEEVPAGIDAVVDAAVAHYGSWAAASPVMLVHAATAPRAAGLVVPSLPAELWVGAHDVAWAMAAAVSAAYRPPPDGRDGDLAPATSVDEVADRAVATGDEHAIKFVEVAMESHRRGNAAALPAGSRAATLLA